MLTLRNIDTKHLYFYNLLSKVHIKYKLILNVFFIACALLISYLMALLMLLLLFCCCCCCYSCCFVAHVFDFSPNYSKLRTPEIENMFSIVDFEIAMEDPGSAEIKQKRGLSQNTPN